VTNNQKIRIYATIPHADGINAWGKHHIEQFERIFSPQVEVTIGDIPKAPINTILSLYDAELVGHLHVEEALKAEADGYDAVAMGCLDEPGVSAAKEALTIPAIGEAEASMHFASMAGRRFSFVGPNMPLDIVRKYGFTSKLASVVPVDAVSLDYAAEEQRLPQEMLDAARRAIKDDGADVIIAYGPLMVIDYLRDQLNVPVIDPVQATVMMAEAMVRLRISQSKKAYPLPRSLQSR